MKLFQIEDSGMFFCPFIRTDELTQDELEYIISKISSD